jgi:hypothetical protein
MHRVEFYERGLTVFTCQNLNASERFVFLARRRQIVGGFVSKKQAEAVQVRIPVFERK